MIKKSEFKKAEEFIIGDYYYKGKPKPEWLKEIGLVYGDTAVGGICEAEYVQMKPL